MRKTNRYLTLAMLALALSGDVYSADGRAEQLRELRTHLAEAERLARSGDPGAEALFQVALDQAEGLGARLPLARALDGLAEARREAGRLDEAEALYARVIPLWEELLGLRQPRLAVSLHNLGALYLERQEPRKAAPLFRRALRIWTTTLGPESPEAGVARQALDGAISAGAAGDQDR